jgi:hypothetical protein
MIRSLIFSLILSLSAFATSDAQNTAPTSGFAYAESSEH